MISALFHFVFRYLIENILNQLVHQEVLSILGLFSTRFKSKNHGEIGKIKY